MRKGLKEGWIEFGENIYRLVVKQRTEGETGPGGRGEKAPGKRRWTEI